MSEPEAVVVRGLLQFEGIAVMTKGEPEGGPYPAGPIELWVPDEFEAQALAILEDARREGTSGEDG
jgi:hypothetical protein